MVQLSNTGVYLVNGRTLVPDGPQVQAQLAALGVHTDREAAKRQTIAYSILQNHLVSQDGDLLRLRFDSLTSHDITYVGVIQTARASGMTQFPMPYVLTNCHNSLCAVGGTINEDDHMFALSAAQKYGGIYVPPNLAVIHSFNREMMSACGNMILGSDSHTRYGALGTMAVGEGGGELAKQLVGRTYDMRTPEVVCIYLTGEPQPGVGPHDVALSIIKATYANGYVKNKIMEFVGPGVSKLPIQFRNGIDVMTTETTCWSSIWRTDEQTQAYFAMHGRPQAYEELNPGPVAYYSGLVEVDLSTVEPSIALPFHPSNVYTIAELRANAADILDKVERDCLEQLGKQGLTRGLAKKVRDGQVYVDQGIVAGCAGGTFDNLCDVADILEGQSVGNGGFTMSVYPDSQPNYLELVRNGSIAKIMAAGAIVRSAFCGPCFGAGDTPANGELSIRHTTRNFPNREGSKPGDGQLSYVALMDARSIAASSLRGGAITPATELDVEPDEAFVDYRFDDSAYRRVYRGVGRPQPEAELVFGPNIADWPAQVALPENLYLTVASAIYDPVTTTDELIPSGETSSYRSNPLKLSEFALSRKDPQYVGRAKAVLALERRRREDPADPEVAAALDGHDPRTTGLGSLVMAIRPGDGSAREQAASCQRVLGGCANLCEDYATKRYRSNVINWGMLPFTVDDIAQYRIQPGDKLYLPGIRAALERGDAAVTAQLIQNGQARELTLKLENLTAEDRDILLAGCLINYYANH